MNEFTSRKLGREWYGCWLREDPCILVWYRLRAVLSREIEKEWIPLKGSLYDQAPWCRFFPGWSPGEKFTHVPACLKGQAAAGGLCQEGKEGWAELVLFWETGLFQMKWRRGTGEETGLLVALGAEGLTVMEISFHLCPHYLLTHTSSIRSLQAPCQDEEISVPKCVSCQFSAYSELCVRSLPFFPYKVVSSLKGENMPLTAHHLSSFSRSNTLSHLEICLRYL